MFKAICVEARSIARVLDAMKTVAQARRQDERWKHGAPLAVKSAYTTKAPAPRLDRN